MEENRDEILANFQSCTGIEDVCLALKHLEDTDWDLARAVNRAIPDESVIRTNDSSPDVEMIQEFLTSGRRTNIIDDDDDDDEPVIVRDKAASNAHTVQTPSTGRHLWSNEPCLPSTSLDNLCVIVECTGRLHNIQISPNATVLELKKRIEAVTNIKVCQQSIIGWHQQPRHDSVSLNSLSLSSPTRLWVQDNADDSATDEVVKNLEENYSLNIRDEKSGASYSLTLPGQTSVLDVKMNLYQLTNIPVRHQFWTGWPDAVNDRSLLGRVGLDRPNHSLTVNEMLTDGENRKTKKLQNKDNSDDSSVEEFEDAADSFNGDEDVFSDDFGIRKHRPLIPDKIEDETVGCLHFAEEFPHRFGQTHPEFFPGSLDEAIKEACMKPAKERRLLALYLHHDRSVLSNVFCTQLLCSDSVINLLAAYFVLWAWDLTFNSNQQRFFNSLTCGLGPMGAMQIRNIPVERLPAIVIINRVRSNIEILSVIQGNVGIDELTASLSETVDVFVTQKNVEVREEEERTARETIKQQQDAAFQESLEMDRAKEEAKRQQEQVQEKEMIREMQQREHEAAQKEAERIHAEACLPLEPLTTATEITKIRVRIPQGQHLERRFNETDYLQTLFDWLLAQGYRRKEIKLLTSWPRRDLTGEDSALTLKQLSLCPQETLILEER